MSACRSAAMFSLPEAAAAAGISESAARKAMNGLVRRGRCAELASLMLKSSKVSARDAERAAIQAAPPAVRSLNNYSADNTRAAVAGVAGWATRQDLRLRENAPRYVIAVAAASDDDNSAFAAKLDVCPSGVLTRLAGSSDWGIRTDTASNSATPAPVLALLACDNDTDVSYAVATNPNVTPLALITAAAHGSEATAREVYEGALDAVLAADREQEVQTAVAANPNCGSAAAEALAASLDADIDVDRAFVVVRAMAVNESSSETRIAAASHRHWCAEMLLHGLAQDYDVNVRAAVAASTGCDPETFEMLAEDDDDSVRVVVASNLAAPEETLRQLTQDDTLEVADAATATMQQRNLSTVQHH